MPELPSLEVYKLYFDSTSLNQIIDHVEIRNPEILINTKPSTLKKKLQDQEFTESRRYGKYLFAELTNNYFLILHFGMTGYLKYFQKEGSSYIRLLISFKNGYNLALDDMRKFGKAGLTNNPEQFIHDRNLGPDALEIDFRTFEDKIKKRKGMIKSLLLNQNFLAGIGNLYADEILYQCGIHPLSKADKLNKKTLLKLFKKMKMVLNKAIEYQDKPDNLPSSFLLPHRHYHGKCPHGEILKIIKVGGRTTYFCPEHQKLFD